MDFSLTTLFVVKPGNTLPTTGNKAAMTGSTFGIFRSNYTAATAANIAAEPYIYLAQNRLESIPGLGTKTSDKIYKNNVVTAYKVLPVTSAVQQITEVDDFVAHCGEQVSITLRLFSDEINIGYFNGLTRTVTINTPCCDCGDDPCVDMDADAIEDMVDEFVAAINADTLLARFVVASKSGTGATAKVVITGKASTTYGPSVDPFGYLPEYNRLKFFVYAYKGPETSQDDYTFDRCDPFATVTTTQQSDFIHGSSAEIALLEKHFHTYQTTHKDLFRNSDYNRGFTSYVVDGTFYELYYIKFKNQRDDSFSDESVQTSTVIVAIPSGAAATFVTIMETFLGSGAFVNKTGA